MSSGYYKYLEVSEHYRKYLIKESGSSSQYPNPNGDRIYFSSYCDHCSEMKMYVENIFDIWIKIGSSSI